MRLQSVTICDVGRFNGTHTVDGFQDGLNILAAPNEAGKSTFFGALRAVFTEAPGSKNARTKPLVPHAGGTPHVAVIFEHGGARYELSKGFVGPKRAVLRLLSDQEVIAGQHFAPANEGRGGRVLARDGSVDAALGDLLAAGAPAAKIGATLATVLPQLWHPQGSDLTEPELLSQHGRQLVAALAEAGATQIASSQAIRAVHRQALGDLEALESGTQRRPRGDLLAARESVADARLALECAEQARAAVDDLLVEVSAADEACAQARAGEAQMAADNPLATLEAARTEAASYADRLAAAKNTAALAQARVEAVVKDHEQCSQLVREEGELRGKFNDLREALPGPVAACIERCDAPDQVADIADALDAMVAATQVAEREAEQELERIAAARGLARGRFRRGGQIGDIAGGLEQMRDAASVVARVALLRRKHADLSQAINNHPCDAGELTDVLQSAMKLEAAAAALADSAGTVTIERDDGSDDRLRVDGAVPGTAKTTSELAAPMVIEITGIGRITITPPADSLAQRAALSERLTNHDARLAGLGFSSVQAVEEALAGLTASQQELSTISGELDQLKDRAHRANDMLSQPRIIDLRTDLVALLADDNVRNTDALETSASWLERLTAWTEQAVQGAPPAIEPQVLTDLVDLSRELKSSGEQREATCSKDAAAAQASVSAIQRLRARAEALSQRAQMLAATLAERQEAPEHGVTRLAEQRAQERRTLVLSTEMLHAVLADAPARSVHEIEAEIEVVRRDAKQRQAALAAAERRLAEAYGRLNQALIDDPDAACVRCRHAVSQARARLRRVELRVAGLRHITAVLQAQINEAGALYVQPIKERLSRYLAPVVGTSGVALAESGTVTAVTRAGVAEPVQCLSHGTREQVMVMARAALGGFLADAGLAFPLVLDDALCSSDPQRFAQALAVLRESARAQQVILFSCRNDVLDTGDWNAVALPAQAHAA